MEEPKRCFKVLAPVSTPRVRISALTLAVWAAASAAPCFATPEDPTYELGDKALSVCEADRKCNAWLRTFRPAATVYETKTADFEKALKLAEAIDPTLPFRTEILAMSLDFLATAYQVEKKFKNAERAYLRALSLTEEDRQFDLLFSLRNLYGDSKDREKEIDAQKKILALDEKHTGAGPGVPVDLSFLASLYEDKGDWSAALPLRERAIEMERKMDPDGHPASDSLESYAACLRKSGRPDEKVRKELESVRARDESRRKNRNAKSARHGVEIFSRQVRDLETRDPASADLPHKLTMLACLRYRNQERRQTVENEFKRAIDLAKKVPVDVGMHWQDLPIALKCYRRFLELEHREAEAAAIDMETPLNENFRLWVKTQSKEAPASLKPPQFPRCVWIEEPK